jgi:hypothetical protein
VIEVSPVHGAELAEPLKLLEESLTKTANPCPATSRTLREAEEAGGLEVLAARAEGRVVELVS